MTPKNKFIQIDEEGYFLSSGVRATDEDYGRELLSHLKPKGRGLETSSQGDSIIVEAFDAPLVIRHLEKAGDGFRAVAPYGFETKFVPATLRVDEWDRFHGRTTDDVPFVLGRQAQMELFDLCDEFDDDSITVNGTTIPVTPLLPDVSDPDQSEFWSEKYRAWSAAGDKPGWELGGPHPALAQVLPQLKLNKSKIAVLGCGAAHDAAELARQGHLVTAIDVSVEAVAKASELYGNVDGLTFVNADAFKLEEKFNGAFDLVFEHTFFCAINPVRRNDLIKQWRRLLTDEGHLLAIFFLIDYAGGPPFGATEWELRQRLRSSFHSLYWTRWRQSPPDRQGMELVVYARKTNAF